VLNLLEDLQKQLNLTYLFISHNLSVVKHSCQRIGVMYLGKLVEFAPSEQIYIHALHPYTKALISAIPVIDDGSGAAERESIVLSGDLPSPVSPPAGCAFSTRCPYAMDRCRQEKPPMKETDPALLARYPIKQARVKEKSFLFKGGSVMKRVVAIFIACLFVLGSLTACSTGSSGRATPAPAAAPAEPGATAAPAAQPKTVVIGAQSDLITLDPGNMYEPYANMISYAAYDMLYRVQSGTMGTPEPSVATGVEIDDTKTVYTFKLRDDVVFASGNKLTAKDVVWSIKRVLNMKDSNAYSNVKIVSKVERPTTTPSCSRLRSPTRPSS
jgi:oligopeptide/dipeptide ABC transporter ATP-binding protein